MDSLITLISILTPLFIGFFIRVPKQTLLWVDKGLNGLVYVILTLIGISLSQVDNIGHEIGFIAGAAALLFVCVIGMNLLVLMVFDRKWPWQNDLKGSGRKARISIRGSVQQIACVLLGFVLGRALKESWLPPESANTYALMLLVLLVGVQLGSSGITLRKVLINRRGVETFVLITVSGLIGGALFALLMPGVKLTQGLALASGFGWYSLSGIVLTDSFGPVIGSAAFFNDLARELCAIMLIPTLVRSSRSTALGLCGATSMDFTLPVLQRSGGLDMVPPAVVHGFVLSLLSPVLMAFFSA